MLHPHRPRTRRARHLVGAIALLAAFGITSACGFVDPPVPPPGNQLVFGLGPVASNAKNSRLAKEAPLGMYTTWYNGPGDLGWLSQWWDDEVPNAYKAGKSMHLIVYASDGEGTVNTPYGTGCGRAYPLSSRFLDDMRQLAQTFKGNANSPPLFITLFTEFQTYACTDNQWNPNPQTYNYVRALKDRYNEARQVFKDNAPNAKVSIGWGGWQADWDSPATGGGKSMIQYFDDAMTVSDFQSVQAMSNSTNVDQIKRMTKILGAWGPVMVAHYKPDNSSQSTFDADVKTLFNDATLSGLKKDGLFAFSFMDGNNMNNESSYQAVKSAVQKYGAMP